MGHQNVSRTILILKEKQQITPHYIRGIFTADTLDQYATTTVGDNNKIFIPPVGVKEIHFSWMDENTGETVYPEAAVKPTLRTYTHRYLDLEKKELYIDFVDHGDEGVASRWINHAEAGDKLGVAMKLDPKELYNKEAGHFILVGDATAIPVIAAILEKLPATADVQCIIEVKTEEDEQQLFTEAQATFQWLHNPHPEKGSELGSVIKQLALPLDKRFAFVAAEFSTVKEARTYLRKTCGWTKEELYAYSYWKAGFAESESVSDRKAEKES